MVLSHPQRLHKDCALCCWKLLCVGFGDRDRFATQTVYAYMYTKCIHTCISISIHIHNDTQTYRYAYVCIQVDP